MRDSRPGSSTKVTSLKGLDKIHALSALWTPRLDLKVPPRFPRTSSLLKGSMKTAALWPKSIPELTPEQKRISDDFMRYWHEVLPKKYGVVDDFNHGYPVS